MGASQPSDTQAKLPAKGSRIMQIMNPELENKLQLFTDYIIDPAPQQLKTAMGEIKATIFSSLDYSLRQETLPISHNHLGARIKVTNIHESSLKVTKVFPNSPCQRLGIGTEEYIVGLVEAEYTNLSSFAQALHSIINAQKQIFTLAVCNSLGITRLIPVPVTMINDWKSSNQGLLGCQLAEGWMHRFKGRPKRGNPQPFPQPQEKKEEKMKQEAQQEQARAQGLRQVEGEGYEEWEQIERKVGGQTVGQSIQVRFKGLLKNQYLQDASTICRCKLYDKSCERCWIERDGGFHFFNKKTNRIVAIPSELLLSVYE